MLKQKRQLVEFFFMMTDLIVVTISWILAYYLRFKTNWVPIDKGIPDFNHYLSMSLFIWPIWIFIFRKSGLYKPMRGVRRVKEVWLLINANIFSIIFLIALTYLFREKTVPFSRLVFVYFGLLSTTLTLVQRLILRFFLREARRRGYNLRYVLIVGAGKTSEGLAISIRAHKELGIQLIGCLSKSGKEEDSNLPVIGSYDDLGGILKDMSIDQVIIALPIEDSSILPRIMSQIGDALVDIRIVPDLYRFISIGGSIEEFEGLPIIALQESPLSGINLYLKRIFDVLISLFLITLFSPFMLLIAVLVKLTSKGPVFYKQERVSLDGTPFRIYKFRTMYTDAEEKGPGWTKENDARVTEIGKFLRKSSLDEIPQFFNVLSGKMSLVGPRPERPVYIEEFRKRIPHYMLRHKVPAGITGWAQVHGWRGDTSIDKRVEFDLFYIKNWSLYLDIKILFLTLIHLFDKEKNAY